jgi:hypothetical protein
MTFRRHSGAPRSGEPGIHGASEPLNMDSGFAGFARAPE